jgi:hypothetical protein
MFSTGSLRRSDAVMGRKVGFVWAGLLTTTSPTSQRRKRAIRCCWYDLRWEQAYGNAPTAAATVRQQRKPTKSSSSSLNNSSANGSSGSHPALLIQCWKRFEDATNGQRQQ